MDDPSDIIGPKTERCPICGIDFREFPAMYHEAEDCDGPECMCYEIIGGHQLGCPLAKRDSVSHSVCPRCEGRGTYCRLPGDPESVCGVCDGTGKIGPTND